MIYQIEPFHEIAEYVAEKVPEHYEEVKNREGSELPNMDWDYYLEASLSGQCIAITARDQGKLVGYSVFFIETNANHKHILEAVNSGIFLERKYRGRESLNLLRKTTEMLKQRGVHTISYLLKDDRIGKLLSRNGYKMDMKLWSIK